MTISFKQMAIAAAAVVTMASAQAATYPGVVTNTFVLDTAIIDGLKKLGGDVTFTPIGTGVSFDTVTGSLSYVSTNTTFTAAGGTDLVDAAIGSGLKIASASGLSLSLKDLVFNGSTNSISGKILNGTSEIFSGEMLKGVGGFSVPDTFESAGTGKLLTGMMRMTVPAGTALATALTNPFLGGMYGSQVAGYNFGSLTVQAIPEPSTYALMALGLVGVGLTARKRKSI